MNDEMNSMGQEDMSMPEEGLAVRISLQGMQSVESNLSEIRESLERMIAPFRGYHVTEENLQESKSTLANLRKAETALEDERKRCRKEWEKPYKDWEARYKEAIEPLQGVIALMSNEVYGIEAEAECKRIIGRKGFIETLLAPINEQYGLRISTDQIWEQKWKLKGTSDKAFTMESTARVQQVMQDLAAIADKDRAVIMRYAERLSLPEALSYEKELNAPVVIREEAEPASAPDPEPEMESRRIPPVYRFEFSENSPAEEQREVIVVSADFRAERWKLNALMDVARQLGIRMRTARPEGGR